MSTHADRSFSLHVLPPGTAERNLLRAHLEAHDHLAMATDRADGGITVTGSYSQREEILEVVGELSLALRLLRLEP